MKISTKFILTKLLYIIPLLFFIFGLITNLKNLNLDSSFGIKYKYIFIVPILIFLYQSIRNTKTGWVLVILLYLIFLTAWITNLVDSFTLIGLKYSITDYLFWCLFVVVYLGLGWVYYKFRPKKREHNKREATKI